MIKMIKTSNKNFQMQIQAKAKISLFFHSFNRKQHILNLWNKPLDRSFPSHQFKLDALQLFVNSPAIWYVILVRPLQMSHQLVLIFSHSHVSSIQSVHDRQPASSFVIVYIKLFRITFPTVWSGCFSVQELATISTARLSRRAQLPFRATWALQKSSGLLIRSNNK